MLGSTAPVVAVVVLCRKMIRAFGSVTHFTGWGVFQIIEESVA
jgi:hypothetical protein